MRRGGTRLRKRMESTELHLERVTAEAGVPLAGHANATIMAGGKRLRPLLVVLAAESAWPCSTTARYSPASPARPDGGEECSYGQRWRSSSCTRRRSCTTI